MTKVTIVAGTDNRLLDCLIENLSNKEIKITRIQQPILHNVHRLLIWPRLICLGLLDFLKITSSKPNVVAYHFFGPRSLLSAIWLQIIGTSYVIHFWGSDYQYWKKRNNLILRFCCQKAKFVTFANTQLQIEAKELLGAGIKFRTLRFGLEAIDLIDKHHSYIDAKKINVVVGTNAQPGQQHREIIDAISQISEASADNFFYIFPLNYGDQKNKEAVKEQLKQSKLRHEVIENYLLGKDLAKFRQETSILIQLQKTDAMSGAMLESLYAGAKVITGSWLPYDDLRTRGISWQEIENISDLIYTLPRITGAAIDHKKNKEIVASIARWKNLTPEWIDCYLN